MKASYEPGIFSSTTRPIRKKITPGAIFAFLKNSVNTMAPVSTKPLPQMAKGLGLLT